MQETKPRMLATPELLSAYWPQIEPLLAASPISEEISPNQILAAATAGNMIVFVFEEDTVTGPAVELVMVLTSGGSAAAPSFTVVTVAGKSFKKHIDRFWEHFKGWCALNGARAIDAYVPERMLNITEQLGFKRKSVHVRLCL